MSSSKNSDFSFGAIFGLLLGFSLSTLVWTLPLPQIKTDNWIYQYQTLIAGVIALVAAAVSFWMIYQQILQARKFAEEENDREQRAARPILSFVMVSLLNYSQHCYKVLRLSYRDLIPNSNGFVPYPRLDGEIPNVPAGVFEAIKENLKYGTPSAISVLSRLLSKLQIQNSRMLQLKDNESKDEFHSLRELHVYAADSLELITYCVRMFAYSRSEIDEVDTEINSGHLIHAAVETEIFASQDPLMLYLLQRYQE